jgi:hypothetical protein
MTLSLKVGNGERLRSEELARRSEGIDNRWRKSISLYRLKGQFG